MKSDPALIIAKDGYNVSSTENNLVMDTRGNIFHFINRKDKGGDLPYSFSFVTFLLTSYEVRHELGYPPFFMAWSYGIGGYEIAIGSERMQVMVESSEYISDAGDMYCDDTKVFVAPSSAYSVYLTIGTYNMESPPDYTFHVS